MNTFAIKSLLRLYYFRNNNLFHLNSKCSDWGVGLFDRPVGWNVGSSADISTLFGSTHSAKRRCPSILNSDARILRFSEKGKAVKTRETEWYRAVDALLYPPAVWWDHQFSRFEREQRRLQSDRISRLSWFYTQYLCIRTSKNVNHGFGSCYVCGNHTRLIYKRLGEENSKSSLCRSSKNDSWKPEVFVFVSFPSQRE